MLLTKQYNLFPAFFAEKPTGMELLLADNAILNSVIKAENDAQEKSLKKRRDERDHPGMERFESVDDFWDEVESATED